MSFQSAIPHLQSAMTHAKGGNAAKAMHHVGHALRHLRSMTMNAGSMDPLEGRTSAGQDSGEAWAGGGKSLQGSLATDAGVKDGTPPQGGAYNPDVATSVRGRLAGFRK